jgi:hypothetical protein
MVDRTEVKNSGPMSAVAPKRFPSTQVTDLDGVIA